jgi:type III secretory pathway component EscU
MRVYSLFTHVFAHHLKGKLRVLLDKANCPFSKACRHLLGEPVCHITILVVLFAWKISV